MQKDHHSLSLAVELKLDLGLTFTSLVEELNSVIVLTDTLCRTIEKVNIKTDRKLHGQHIT